MVTEGLPFFASGVVPLPVGLSLDVVPALAKRSSRSSISPCFANGAGSMPRLVKRSATDAKHLSALSETWRRKLCLKAVISCVLKGTKHSLKLAQPHFCCGIKNT